ncbi:WD repeat-containing protein 46 [Coprinopsis marcescibilis]|uniref:WD repeat-containing protein 46 n=1 Tax=Coprinopsis marcescibilis TaxID=230819 RepID=A0A5C3KT74_COPMA|nr:WD repeat-containing protein 46 [Coprinopsis marcescibilis]
MDSLFAKADAIQPRSSLNHKRKRSFSSAKDTKIQKGKGKQQNEDDDDPHKTRHDHTLHTVMSHTGVPKSLAKIPSSSKDAIPKYTPTQVPNKKLRTALHTQHTLSAQYASHTSDTQDLLALAAEDAGAIQLESPLERTWRISQDEIAKTVGAEAAKGRRELVFPSGGVKRMRWTRNGRHLVFISGKGGSTVSSVDWLNGNVNAQVELAGVGNGGSSGMGGKGDGARDVCFLQDQSFWAVAQRRNVFMYDKDGVEVHKLGKIVDPMRLEFLPWHWLLVAVTNTSHLIYTDTTTGSIVAQHSFTKSSASSVRLSPALSLAQNPHTAITYMGHTNGQVSLWTPNMSRPVVQVLAHLGGVSCVSVDPSDRGGSGSTNTLGRYMATSGRDHKVKIWDCRYWKGVVREWTPRSGGGSAKGSGNAHADIELEWSQKGYLAVASGGSVNVYHPPAITTPFTASGNGSLPPLYLTHPIAHRPITSLRFQPFHDTLAVGHANGLSSILVPGVGEPQFDSLEADPYENSRARREREVKGLLDKLSPDMISLDPSFIGKLDPTVGKSITEDGVRTTTAAQSVLDARDRKRLPASSMTAAADKEYSRMSRVEKLGVQGKLDLGEVRDDDRLAGNKAARIKSGDSDSDASSSSDEDDDASDGGNTKEDKEKKRLRGRNKALKRYLRKQRKNVVDPAVIAIRAKVEKLRVEESKRREKVKVAKERAAAGGPAEDDGEGDGKKRRSALDRFRKKD